MRWKTVSIVVLFLVGIIAIFHIAGIGGGQLVTVDKGEEFTVGLLSNPSGGYQWTADYDDEMLSLVETNFNSDQPRIGSSGIRTFVFKGLKEGTTRVEFTYTKSAGNEKEPEEKRLYKVFVK